MSNLKANSLPSGADSPLALLDAQMQVAHQVYQVKVLSRNDNKFVPDGKYQYVPLTEAYRRFKR
ncbi:MAG: hypothetical protein HS114_34740 [Anaerolineales bacterium]|nr:hypothetical protein [Anaerolineales bacterium]